VDDLRRFITKLVGILGERQPDRVWASIQVSELYQSILPYRSYKRELGFDTNEDYEMAILRLLGGEGGYVIVEPPEVQDQLALEASAANPDPGLFREFAAARLRLNPDTVRRITRSSEAYAPPTPPAEARRNRLDEADAAPRTPPVFEAVEHAARRLRSEAHQAPTPASCARCGESLPSRPDLIFCPYCGGRAAAVGCPRCGADLEAGWRYCVVCGAETE